MEIVQERLEREFNIDLITTCPNVSYNVLLKDGSETIVDNPSEMPISNEIDKIFEPFLKLKLLFLKITLEI